MKSVLTRVKKQASRARGHFPSPLPVGMAEFDSFANSIFDAYNLPNMPSYRHAIATMIMHLPPTQSRVPKKYFAASIKKAQSNEVAYQVIQDSKAAEKAFNEAREATESTVALEPTNDQPPQDQL